MSISSEITRISGNVSDALTAIAQKGVTVPSGSNSDDLADLIAQISGGGTGAVSVVDTTDTHGGTVRTITALDISDTTAVASDVAQGKYFYTAAGVKTAGTGSGGGSGNYTRTTIAAEQTVTPTSNGTYLAATLNTSAFESGEDYIITYNGTEYYFTCTVMWGTNYLLGDLNYFYGNTGAPYPFGIIWMTGTTCTLACGDSTAVTVKIEKIELIGSAVPTQHSIYFEFTDETDTTITAYWDGTFISNAITATTPTTYGQKTVTLAQLDGVTWYEFDPSETWETLFDGYVDWYQSEGDYPYCWISTLGNVPITVGSVYRVTYNNVEYRCTAKAASIGGRTYNVFGNPRWADEGGTDDGSDVPFVFADYTIYGAWSGGLNVPNVGATYYFKIEHLVTS